MSRKLNFRISIFLVFVALISSLFFGCDSAENINPAGPENHERGEIDQLSNIGNLDLDDIQQILGEANIPSPFTLQYPVKALSVRYYTIDDKGSETRVSGALYVPQNVDNLPLVSIQHGTETKRDLVASVSPTNSVEGHVGLIMASMGYLVVIPDYPGFGVSTIKHPYMHAESIIPSIIDLMRAGVTYCLENQVTLDGRTFLTGYSEGGYLSLLTQKTIEEEYASEFGLTAVAPSSGPYDLEGMMQTIFQSTSYSTPAYLAYFLTAYNEIYNWNRLDDFFNEPYENLVSTLFDGSQTWGEILYQLPSTFSALVDSTFIANVNNGNEEDFLTALQENTILNWSPQTPIHFFHGDADEIVPIQNVYTAMFDLTQAGAIDIQLTVIPDGTHQSSGPAAILGTIEWFETF
ncbi:alpha/beta hydrolase family protein [Candidatus Cloacimonadota bacterium]